MAEPVIDPRSAAAALQKALSSLGHGGSAYASTDTDASYYGAGYVDHGELRPGGSGFGGPAAGGCEGSESSSFYGAYIIRPTVVERSTIDSRPCQGITASRLCCYAATRRDCDSTAASNLAVTEKLPGLVSCSLTSFECCRAITTSAVYVHFCRASTCSARRARYCFSKSVRLAVCPSVCLSSGGIIYLKIFYSP